MTAATKEPQRGTLLHRHVQTVLVLGYLGLVALGFTWPGMPRVFWTMLLPLLPIAIVLMGFANWRRICPLAAFGEVGRFLNRGEQRRVPAWLERWFFPVTFALLLAMLVLRLVATNGDGRWLAWLLVGLAAAAALTNLVFTGKSWCNFVCPVGFVERVYTEPNSLPKTANSQCVRCTACKKNCPDIDQENAYWRDLTSPARRAAIYAFPGLVLGFYTYYWLRAGTWDAYFDGRWTNVPVSAELVAGSGFFFAPGVPALLAATLTLVLFSAASLALWSTAERVAAPWVEGQERRRHILLATAAFAAFCLFYFFAGAPTLLRIPGGARVMAFVAPVLATTMLVKRWRRTRTHFIGERGAVRLQRTWQFDEAPPEDPAEVYAWIKAGEYAREQQLAAYEQTAREMVADGLLGPGELRLLEGVRKQLGITEREHEKIFARLEEEDDELFHAARSGGVESRAQLEGYETALSEALLRQASDLEIAGLREAFGIDPAQHQKILGQLRSGSGSLYTKARHHLARARELHSDLIRLALSVPEPTPALLLLSALLRRARDEAARRVFEYLELSGDPKRMLALQRGLMSPDLATRRAAVDELASQHPSRAEIVEELSNISVATVAVDPSTDSTALLDLLERQCQVVDPYIRAAAAWALADVPGDRAMALLETAAQDREALVRETAAHARGLRAAGRSSIEDSSDSFTGLQTIERMQTLRSVALFADIDSEDLHDLALMTEELLQPEGEPIFREGEFDDGDMFVLLDGAISIRVRQADREAPDREVEMLHPGEVIGEFSVLDRRPRGASALPVDGPARLLRIPGAALQRRLLNRPRMLQPLLRTLADRLRKMTRRAAAAS